MRFWFLDSLPATGTVAVDRMPEYHDKSDKEHDKSDKEHDKSDKEHDKERDKSDEEHDNQRPRTAEWLSNIQLAQAEFDGCGPSTKKTRVRDAAVCRDRRSLLRSTWARRLRPSRY
jgi:hypothetical protein